MSLGNATNENEEKCVIIQPYQEKYSGLVRKILTQNLEIFSRTHEYTPRQIDFLEEVLTKEILTDSASIILKGGNVRAAGNLIITQDAKLIPYLQNSWVSHIQDFSCEGRACAERILRYLEGRSKDHKIGEIYAYSPFSKSHIDFYGENNYYSDTITNHPGIHPSKDLPVIRMRKFLSSE